MIHCNVLSSNRDSVDSVVSAMEDAQRWSVTYTKHVKQKRKVYHDGVLDHYISTNKLMLYDECEKLMESRILKKDEFVRCGETLEFNSFLVDIGDREGHQKPLSDFNHQGREKKIKVEPGLDMHVRRTVDNSGCVDQKTSAEKKKLPFTHPSFVQKVIKEFKKSDLHNFKTPLSSAEDSDSTKSIHEWQVLYTPQVTQKAKRYHDGTLQLTRSGCQGRQVMLYDATGKLLDSRYLKKDEVIESGETLKLDAHLVDIGEPVQRDKSSEDSEAGGKAMQNGQQKILKTRRAVRTDFDVSAENYQAPSSSPGPVKYSMREWQVLYTTQITQKSKKYHDGILQLAILGVRGRQVKLYDTSRTILDSRFLKKDETIESGQSLTFGAHLVDVGDLQKEHEPIVDLENQDSCSNIGGQTRMGHEQSTKVEAKKFAYTGEPRKTIYSEKASDINFSRSSADLKTESSLTKPLRDAHQILFSLKKPFTINSDMHVVEAQELGHASQVTKMVQKDPKDLSYEELEQNFKLVDRNAAENDEGFKSLDDNAKTMHSYDSEILVPKPTAESREGVEQLASKIASSCDGSQLVMGIENGESRLVRASHASLETDATYSQQTSVPGILSSSAAVSCSAIDLAAGGYEELKNAEETSQGPSFDLGF